MMKSGWVLELGERKPSLLVVQTSKEAVKEYL
jgi:hypothetical protein